MTPDCRRWTEETIARWSLRAEQLLDHPDATTSELGRAEILELRVVDLRRRLAAAPEEDAEQQRIARLEADYAKCLPYMHPEYHIMFNGGAIMQAVRNSILAKLGRPPEPVELSPRERWRAAPATVPDRDPEPFTFSTQADMFG